MTMQKTNNDFNYNYNVVNNDAWNKYNTKNRTSRNFGAAMSWRDMRCFDFSCSYEIRNGS